MAAQLRDDRHESGLRLVRQEDLRKMLTAVKNPPKPSKKLIQMFAERKACERKD